ncbi:MAG: transposase [Steroidobacteraceae bacterium]|jgi:transposase
MGTSPAVMTDKLGRRSGPRRTYTIAEKRAMVDETERPGASVPEVALRHAVNANLLSVWRRQYRQGVLTEGPCADRSALLPVKVSTPTVLPSERAGVSKVAAKVSAACVEIEFEGGRRLRIRGRIDRALIKDLIAALSSR